MLSWIYIGILSGSIVTGGFDSEEHCEGHRVMLERQKVAGKCVAAPQQPLSFTSGTIQLTPGAYLAPGTSLN